jgi:GNAT superfamily N-acetyltransferase
MALAVSLVTVRRSSDGRLKFAKSTVLTRESFDVTPYRIRQVAGRDRTVAAQIHAFNRIVPECFPELQPRHLTAGLWWLAYFDTVAIAFAGLVPFEPFPGVGYLKRAYVLPEHRGHGLQRQFMAVREVAAKRLGWTCLVSECSADNVHSADNFITAGFARCDPEQPWGAPNSLFWKKDLAA